MNVQFAAVVQRFTCGQTRQTYPLHRGVYESSRADWASAKSFNCAIAVIHVRLQMAEIMSSVSAEGSSSCGGGSSCASGNSSGSLSNSSNGSSLEVRCFSPSQFCFHVPAVGRMVGNSEESECVAQMCRMISSPFTIAPLNLPFASYSIPTFLLVASRWVSLQLQRTDVPHFSGAVCEGRGFSSGASGPPASAAA
jgi:hypothetical protein